MSLEDWNARYRAGEFDATPAELLVRAAESAFAFRQARAPVAPPRALDLACGAGRNAIWLAEQGWEVVAIDGAAEAIRILHEHAPAMDARVMDLEAGAPLPFADDSFDLVCILYYLHRPLFAEAKRVLKPGGTIVCAVKMRGTYRVAAGELREAFDDFIVERWTEGEIAELIARRAD